MSGNEQLTLFAFDVKGVEVFPLWKVLGNSLLVPYYTPEVRFAFFYFSENLTDSLRISEMLA